MVTSALTLSGGRLDVGNGDVDVRGGNVATVTAAAAGGYATGTFNGATGIVSSAALANAGRNTTVGVVVNSVTGVAGGTALMATFDGQPVANTDVLVKYTYFGDANLDGKVDGADYGRIDAGYNSQSTATRLTGWYNGDFNYDGKVDGSDYTLIDNAFNTQGPQITSSVADGGSVLAAATSEIAPVTAAGAAVPEPATVGLLAVGGLGLLVRRRAGGRPRA